MGIGDVREDIDIVKEIREQLSSGDLRTVAELSAALEPAQLTGVLERLGAKERAIVYRILSKEAALKVFESLDPGMQGELVASLRDAEVATLFAELDPDDRVWLLDELPASLASRLLRGLPDRERQLTASVLGYPQNSVGRKMAPEYVSIRPEWTAGEALQKVRRLAGDSESVYTLPVTDGARLLLGIVTLRSLLAADDSAVVGELTEPVPRVHATDDAEDVARELLERRALALPITDGESRLVGILTVDDAARILEREESEDAARQGGVEPLHRPYLSTSVLSIVRSRVVWLFVLAVGASLTVQVLSAFEATIEQVTVLALFVPLLIGTGGNTGNQAATTVTRALALRDVRVRDAGRVLFRELRVGVCLGLLLGGSAFLVTGVIWGVEIGLVIGLTLLLVCTMAATVGGVMPLLAKVIRVDPAVFSNPFITTFVDATGLVVYFLIARLVLGI